jgi:hypothetical protein
MPGKPPFAFVADYPAIKTARSWDRIEENQDRKDGCRGSTVGEWRARFDWDRDCVRDDVALSATGERVVWWIVMYTAVPGRPRRKERVGRSAGGGEP